MYRILEKFFFYLLQLLMLNTKEILSMSSVEKEHFAKLSISYIHNWFLFISLNYKQAMISQT